MTQALMYKRLNPTMAFMNAADDTKRTRIGIIGAGSVGTAFAYALTMNGLAREIFLIDKIHENAQGHALDLCPAVPIQ